MVSVQKSRNSVQQDSRIEMPACADVHFEQDSVRTDRQAQSERISEEPFVLEFTSPRVGASKSRLYQVFAHEELDRERRVQEIAVFAQRIPVRAEPACPEPVEGSKHERTIQYKTCNGIE